MGRILGCRARRALALLLTPLHSPSLPLTRRIGIMGYNARPQNVALVIEAFRDGLRAQGKL